MSRQKLHSRFLIPVIFVLASAVSLKYSSRLATPFVVFLLIAGAWAFAIALGARLASVRNGALVFSSICFALATVESVMYYVERSHIILTRTTPTVWRRDLTDIGSLPVPNTAIEFREFLDGQSISDVTYGIDARGLREISPSIQGRPHKVAFFGCSFMFGHGVNDNETLPYYFVLNSHGTFAGFNFAGEGWGPHQMLRELEIGFVRRVAGVPDLAIYEVIPDHLRRLAGRAPWEDGPKYVLCHGVAACYSGPFHSAYYTSFQRWLNQSWIVKFVQDHFARLSRPSDIPLFLAVMNRTRDVLRQDGTRFVIVLWDQNELAEQTITALRKNKFDVIAVSSIFAATAGKQRSVIQLDRHPSPETNKAIAMYLWKNVGQPTLAR